MFWFALGERPGIETWWAVISPRANVGTSFNHSLRCYRETVGGAGEIMRPAFPPIFSLFFPSIFRTMFAHLPIFVQDRTFLHISVYFRLMAFPVWSGRIFWSPSHRRKKVQYQGNQQARKWGFPLKKQGSVAPKVDRIPTNEDPSITCRSKTTCEQLFFPPWAFNKNLRVRNRCHCSIIHHFLFWKILHFCPKSMQKFK